MSPRRQLGLSITFVDDDDDAVMRVPGIVEKEPSPTVAVVMRGNRPTFRVALYGLPARPNFER